MQAFNYLSKVLVVRLEQIELREEDKLLHLKEQFRISVLALLHSGETHILGNQI